MFSRGTHHILQLLKRLQPTELPGGSQPITPQIDISSQFRVFRAAQVTNKVREEVGLPLVIELPAQLLAEPRHLKEFSAHLNQIVRDAFSQSEQSNKGTRTHRYTCLDPIVYVRLYHCPAGVLENVLHASRGSPLWFSQRLHGGASVASARPPCKAILGDSLHPELRLKLRSAAAGVQAGVSLLRGARQKAASQAHDSGHVGPDAAHDTTAPYLIKHQNVLSNVPVQRNLSVTICFEHKSPGPIPPEVAKFRQLFETSKEFPVITIIGSEKHCSDNDLLEWSACISGSPKSYIIMDTSSSSQSHQPHLRPDVLLPLQRAPCTAVEFSFGIRGAEADVIRSHGAQSSDIGSNQLDPADLDFKQVLQMYHGLYQGFISGLYRDAVLMCNLCNLPPPHEMSISYKHLCECMYTILSSPVLVKDIENALSSTSFQSLVPRLSETESGFIWSAKDQNIFWKGVFAGSIFSELNEIMIGRGENKEGLLKMRWHDSLRRVVQHYEHIGDNNLWARPGYTILFAHEKMHRRNDHDLHRCQPILNFVYFHVCFDVHTALLHVHSLQNANQHRVIEATDGM